MASKTFQTIDPTSEEVIAEVQEGGKVRKISLQKVLFIIVLQKKICKQTNLILS